MAEASDIVKQYNKLQSHLKNADIHTREFLILLKDLTHLRHEIDRVCVHLWEGIAPYTYHCLDCGIQKD